MSVKNFFATMQSAVKGTAGRYQAARGQLAGKRVIITGGGSGIGALMAKEVAAKGASAVVIWDYNVQAGEKVVNEINELGGNALFWQVDVTDTGAINQAAKEVEDKLGGIDVLINNAGVVSGKAIIDITEEDYQRTFDVNVFALYRTVQAFLPGMIARNQGIIVTVASAAGIVGVARQTDYSASKHAAVGFSESLRAELRHRGSKVTTLTVMPFYINTGMFAGVTTRVPWLLPILDPAKVATKIIRRIESGAATVVLPPFARTVLLLKACTPLHDILTDVFGINSTMDGFIGRKPPLKLEK